MLGEHGLLRVADGEGAYAYAAEATASPEVRLEATELHQRLLAAAGLQPAVLPFDAVARAPESAEAAERLFEECGRLVDLTLLGRLAIAVDARDVDKVAAACAPLVETLSLDVDLVPTELDQLLLPNRVLLAHVDSPDVAVAEALGIPVAPYGGTPAPPPWETEPVDVAA
jgi:hypothetical protein